MFSSSMCLLCWLLTSKRSDRGWVGGYHKRERENSIGEGRGISMHSHNCLRARIPVYMSIGRNKEECLGRSRLAIVALILLSNIKHII